MPVWIIAAALGTIALTALLTWILWRMNLPERDHNKRADDGDAIFLARGERPDGTSDGGSDGVE